MSKLGLVIVLILMAGKNYAQDYTSSNNPLQSYFVLIQSVDHQAFYVRLDSQLYPSSPAGHLILSRLEDSTYTIAIGFPGQTLPEQRFEFSIHQKDWTFLLKPEDSGGWGLYDEQGQELKKIANERSAEMPTLAGVKKGDAFSRLMADLVKDTVVMYSTYAMVDSTAFKSSSPNPPSSAPSLSASATPSSTLTFPLTSSTSPAPPLLSPSSSAATATGSSPTIPNPDSRAPASPPLQ